jgi:hypothetical protein
MFLGYYYYPFKKITQKSIYVSYTKKPFNLMKGLKIKVVPHVPICCIAICSNVQYYGVFDCSNFLENSNMELYGCIKV